MLGNAGGYTGAEMRAHAADDALVGISKWELDTPALCVDVDKLTRNIDAMRSRLAPMKVASRPHAKTHKCPTIARMQLAGGSIGICTAKLGEAEVFTDNGIEPILMTTSNVSPAKIRRAMAQRKTNAHFVQAVDHPDNAHDLDAAAKAAGVVARAGRTQGCGDEEAESGGSQGCRDS